MALCSKIRLLLGPFDDGELGPHEMEEVAFHLVECPECKAALDDYRSLGEALRTFAPVPSLEGFAQTITTRLEPSHRRWRAGLTDFWASLGAFGSALQVAGVAAVAAIITLMVVEPYTQRLNFNHGSTSSPATQIARIEPAPLTARAVTPQADRAAVNASANEDTLGEIRHADATASRESEELLSELGGGPGPSVAVWNEPRTDTTVIWVPDQR